MRRNFFKMERTPDTSNAPDTSSKMELGIDHYIFAMLSSLICDFDKRSVHGGWMWTLDWGTFERERRGKSLTCRQQIWRTLEKSFAVKENEEMGVVTVEGYGIQESIF